MADDSVWWTVLLVGFLLFIVGLGVSCLVKPDRFVKRSVLRREGEMLTEWKRLSVQIMGAILAGGAAYMLYDFYANYFSR